MVVVHLLFLRLLLLLRNHGDRNRLLRCRCRCGLIMNGRLIKLSAVVVAVVVDVAESFRGKTWKSSTKETGHRM